jgi:hypothetical protein
LVKIDKMVSEICVILKKTSGRGWGWPRAATLGAFNLSRSSSKFMFGMSGVQRRSQEGALND